MHTSYPTDPHGTLHRREAAEARAEAFTESALSDDPALMSDALPGASQDWWHRFAESLTPAQRELMRERLDEYAANERGRL